MLKVIVLLAVSSVCCAQGRSRPAGRPGYDRPRPGADGDEDDEIYFPTHDYSKTQSKSLEVLYSWKQVDFLFPNDSVRENMIRDQQFIPINNVVLDVDVYEDQSGRRVFVTLPRLRPGVPATLASVTNRQRRGVTLLAPYPDWRSNTQGDCDISITSVFRSFMDPCGRLWALDSGNNNANVPGGSRQVCPPQVVIYDVRNNDQLIGKYRVPSSMLSDSSMLVTITVDSRAQDCSDAFAYIADSLAYKLIVFSFRTKEFWRINSALFSPYPDASMFNINGVPFDLMGGIFGMSVGPVFRGNRRLLYFHCISSVKQSWADTANLQNQSLWRDNMNAMPRAFNLFNGSRPSQSIVSAMDARGVMYFGLTATNELACWNSQRRFDRSNIVSLAKDDTTLQFNSGIKVAGNKLYLATSRLQNYITNQVKVDEDNYRILVGDAQQMIKGTKCRLVSPNDNRFDDTDYEPNNESVDHPTPPDVKGNMGVAINTTETRETSP